MPALALAVELECAKVAYEVSRLGWSEEITGLCRVNVQFVGDQEGKLRKGLGAVLNSALVRSLEQCRSQLYPGLRQATLRRAEMNQGVSETKSPPTDPGVLTHGRARGRYPCRVLPIDPLSLAPF
jgi:hypothetical protein